MIGAVGGRVGRTHRSELGKEEVLGVGVPVIFPPKLAGKGCYVSNEVEMVEVGDGGKGEAFGKDRSFGGRGIAWRD